MLHSQLGLMVLYSLFSSLFFAVRRGGGRKAAAKRTAKYFAIMVGLSFLFGWLMLLTG
jgi:hypothetical protein